MNQRELDQAVLMLIYFAEAFASMMATLLVAACIWEWKKRKSSK